MNQSKISVRYAKALFLLSKEKNVLDTVREDITSIDEVCENGDFISLIESPIVKGSDKQTVLNKIFEGKISDLSLSFLNLILKNKRESYIRDIARNFQDLYKQDQGIKTAVFTSPFAIDEKLKASIAELIKKSFNTEVELKEEVNEDLIGGFILRVGDNQYDASVSSKLQDLKRDLRNATFENKLK